MFLQKFSFLPRFSAKTGTSRAKLGFANYARHAKLGLSFKVVPTVTSGNSKNNLAITQALISHYTLCFSTPYRPFPVRGLKKMPEVLLLLDGR